MPCINKVEPRFEYQEPKKYCKFCKIELDKDDKLGYTNIGYCSITCWLFYIEHKVDLALSKINKISKRIK